MLMGAAWLCVPLGAGAVLPLPEALGRQLSHTCHWKGAWKGTSTVCLCFSDSADPLHLKGTVALCKPLQAVGHLTSSSQI